MMNVCGSKNDSQIYQWVKSYENWELRRLQQLIGKQDRIGKGTFEEKLIETFHAMPNV
ncbi:transposase [Kurthia senegalensis]|uniref:transposase n=1 Tax=Kurthia senegalensis TaxID=1033740 RepID=UPI0002E70593|nr:transposase [Kurthia senegalensis]